MSESGIINITEKACALVAEDIISTYGDINIFTGINNVDKVAPALICWGESITEDFPFSGIFHVKTHIVIKEIAVTSSFDRYNSLVGDIQNTFISSDIESTLTNKLPTSYFVYQVVFDSNNSSIEGDSWINTTTMDIVSTTKSN